MNIDFVRGVAHPGHPAGQHGQLLRADDGPVGHVVLRETLPPDLAVTLFVTVFVSGKFISTFSMLFGYGLSGQVERAHASFLLPGKFAMRRRCVWRCSVCCTGYCCGTATCCSSTPRWACSSCCGAPNTPGSLLIIAGILLGLVVVYAGVGETLGVVFAENENATRPGDFNSAAWQPGEVAAYRDGPYWRTVPYRLGMWLLIVVAVAVWVWVQIVAGSRWGRGCGRRRLSRRNRRRCAARAACFARGADAGGRVAGPVRRGLAERFAPLAWAIAGVVGALAVVTLPLGYVSAFALLAERLPGWLVNTVALHGRMALTVYLSETVVSTFLSYHWGLGWFGRVSPWQQAVVAVAIWAGLVLMSRLWLTSSRRGRWSGCGGSWSTAAFRRRAARRKTASGSVAHLLPDPKGCCRSRPALGVQERSGSGRTKQR